LGILEIKLPETYCVKEIGIKIKIKINKERMDEFAIILFS
jgi:hypothetical protein